MTTDLFKIKRNRLAAIQGQETINQVEHIRSAGAKLTMGEVLVPGIVITTDISAAPVLVKAGSIVRLEVGATTYVAFSTDTSAPAVTSATSPGLKLVAGTYLVVATDDFIRASANPTRVEVVGPETGALGA